MRICGTCISKACHECGSYEYRIEREVDLPVLIAIRKRLLRDRKQEVYGLDRFADAITGKVSTIWFFLIVLGWSTTWLTWNIFAPDALKFDPYPAFVLWLFISNMIQILLMPLILVSQGRQARIDARRQEREYRLMLVAERIEELKIEGLTRYFEKKKEGI